MFDRPLCFILAILAAIVAQPAYATPDTDVIVSELPAPATSGNSIVAATEPAAKTTATTTTPATTPVFQPLLTSAFNNADAKSAASEPATKTAQTATPAAPAAISAPAPTVLVPAFNTAQPAEPASPAIATAPATYAAASNVAEAGMTYDKVSNNYGNWLGEFVNAQYQTDEANRWNMALQHEEAFHDEGDSIGIGNRHVFDEDWFSNIGASFGTHASFLPEYRVDADINRKWLDGHNLITTVGISWDKANDTYYDKALILGLTYYFPAPWIIQSNVRINDSTPGDVIAPSWTTAITYGYNKQYYLTARYVLAREAYQLLGEQEITNGFDSQTFGLTWREWLGEDWGFNLSGEYYENPYYHRDGITISVFKEF